MSKQKMQAHFKHLHFNTFPMVSWGLKLMFVCLFNQHFKYLGFYTNAFPKVGVHFGVIGFNPLYSPPLVRVQCFIPKHIFLVLCAFALHT
jgi:hypothetical protein